MKINEFAKVIILGQVIDIKKNLLEIIISSKQQNIKVIIRDKALLNNIYLYSSVICYGEILCQNNIIFINATQILYMNI